MKNLNLGSAASQAQVAHHKENSKKCNDIAGPNANKVALKPREFGREITNATSGLQTGLGVPGSKAGLNT
jgi:hypothetical protein